MKIIRNQQNCKIQKFLLYLTSINYDLIWIAANNNENELNKIFHVSKIYFYVYYKAEGIFLHEYPIILTQFSSNIFLFINHSGGFHAIQPNVLHFKWKTYTQPLYFDMP